jgi:hypothetical protein
MVDVVTLGQFFSPSNLASTISSFPPFASYSLNTMSLNNKQCKSVGWWESQKERDHWEDQDVGGWTILKWILER